MDDIEKRLARAEARATYAMEMVNILATRLALEGKLTQLDREAITFHGGSLSAKGDVTGERMARLFSHVPSHDVPEQ